MTVSSLMKGAVFTRIAMAVAVGKGDLMGARAYAINKWGEDAPPSRILKAAVVAGSLTPGSDWGSALADFEAAQAEFFGLVRQQSAFGKLIGLRRIPLQTRLVNQTGGASAAWIGEGKPIPINELDFGQATLDPLKLAALVVISAELAANSSPDAETVIRTDLVNATAAALDESFFNPALAGTANLQPASATNGAEVATGEPTDPIAVKAMVPDFAGDLARAYIVASPETLVALSGADLPNVGARGGEIFGIPALPTAGIGNSLALIDPGGIAYGEGDGFLDASAHASVQMNSTPDSPVTAATPMVSLWQMNAVSLRTVKYMNWQRIQPGAVRLLAGAGE